MVGIRRAISLLFLSFWAIQFCMTSWLGPDETFACLFGLSMVYLTAFVGVAANWFWARWFAIGVGNFGALPLLFMLKVGPEPMILIFGLTHLVIMLSLMGEGMAAQYERSENTQERWSFPEESLLLMRRAVKSAGTTLPFLILFALAPRAELYQLAALALGVAGTIALFRARTWSVFALGAAGAMALADGLGLFGQPMTMGMWINADSCSPVMLYVHTGLFAGGLLLVPLLFTRPIARFLRRY